MSTASAKLGLSSRRLRLGAFALFGLGFLALSLPAFAEPMTFWTGIVLDDYVYPGHELHHFVLGTVPSLLLLGVLAQAYRPEVRVGALHTALVIWVCLTVAFTIGGEFSPIHLVLLALLVGMAVTHPTGSKQVPPLEGLDRPMVALAGITALGGLAFAGVELSSHLTVSDAHVEFGHYMFMATAGSSVAVLSLYASFRGIGWRFPAYAAAVILLAVGLGSIVYPGSEQGSSLGVELGIVIVLWSLLFVLVAERETLADRLRA